MKKEKATSSDNKKSGEPVKLLVLHGPNLNLLGTHEPNYYGLATLSDINLALARRAAAVGAELESFQSNHEGALIERVHAAREQGVRYIILNPAAYCVTGRHGGVRHSLCRGAPIQRSLSRNLPPSLVFF